MCTNLTELTDLLTKYDEVYSQLQELKAVESAIKSEVKGYMSKRQKTKLEESSKTGAMFSCTIVNQVRTTLDKEKVKALLTEDEFDSVTKTSESEFVKITKLKKKEAKLPKGVL
jgi:hypothetical protein